MAITERMPAPSSVLAWYRSRRGWAFVAAAWAVPFLLHFLFPHSRLNPAVPVLRQASWLIGIWTAWGWWLILLHPAFRGDRATMGLRAMLLVAGILLSAALCFMAFWLGSVPTADRVVPNGPRLNRTQTLGTLRRQFSGFPWGGGDCEGPAIITLGLMVTELPLDVQTCNGYETYGAIEAKSMTFDHRPDLRLIALKATCVHGDSYQAPCYVALWRSDRLLGLTSVPLGLTAFRPIPWWADRDVKIRKLLGSPAASP